MVKEELGGGLVYDALLAGCQKCHLIESINNHEDMFIPMLVEGRLDM